MTAAQFEDETADPLLKGDGNRLVVVPDGIGRQVGNLSDQSGRAIMDLDSYREAWNDSFAFTFLPAAALTVAEQKVFDLTATAAALADRSAAQVPGGLAV